MMKKGFTLIELMVVIAIVAFLAMIAIPSFMTFLAKAKRSEAYMNLHAIYAAQKAYWMEHGKYANALTGPDGIGWKPEGAYNYTYGFGYGSEGKQFFTGKLGTSSAHLSKAHAGPDSFLVIAAGDIDGDGQPDILSIDQFNTIVVLQDDLQGT
jgi:prepilin-type N-terminal cleavage/methylation domain-containing protein